MMKALWYGMILSLFGGVSSAVADEKPQLETAWGKYSRPMATGPYVYGALPSIPDVFHNVIYKHQCEPDEGDTDPFAAAESNHSHKQKTVSKKNLPRCLPPRADYYDLSEFLRNQGITLQKSEWVLYSTGLTGDNHIHFCTSATTAATLEQLILVLQDDYPRSIHQITTLVSIENQGINNTAWTIENLRKESPRIHARYGLHGRSGEAIDIKLTPTNSASQTIYKLEPVISENSKLIDCRYTLASNNTAPSTKIHQHTDFTAVTQQPFILDCGTHGKDQRNFLLVINSNISVYSPPARPTDAYVSFGKIEGIYAMPPSPDAKPAPEAKFLKYSYKTNPDFLEQLQKSLIAGDASAPFEDSPVKPLTKVTTLTNSKHHQTSDQVFDLSPLFAIPASHKETVYFNKTRNQLIIHGPSPFHNTVLESLKYNIHTPRQVRVNARIVTLDRDGLDSVEWSLTEISKRNPKVLAHYSSTARSGEKASSGKAMHESVIKDPKSDKKKKHIQHEFTIEPVIGENNEWLDILYSIHSQPLGEARISIQYNSTATIQDGSPLIIELGHPSSSKRTHLLILHADITTPDGSFYRDRFKLVK